MIPFSPENCLILVVDDISQNLQVIGEMLEKAGYETTFATSGKQAIERVKSIQPDLILLDLMMPVMNGIEVCEQLKLHPDFCKIPIIFLTASNEREDLVQAFKKGAADYITKPFKPEEVLIRIENQLTNKILKKQLEEQNQRLQEEIEVRRCTEEALKQAKEAAEAANCAKSIFLTNMSHELRTPLNAILGFAQLMSHSPNLTSEEQKNLNIIHRSGEHLLNLINDILDLSKIEAGRIILNETNFDLMEMLLEVKEMFQLKAEEKGLLLEFFLKPGIPQFIKSDRLKLRQILINLIGNAIKFTKSGSVTLEISSQKYAEKTFLYCEVLDTGVGMNPEELNNIFKPFVQTKAGISCSEGTGLGLAISRKYVQLLGGDISVISQVDKGTTFKFQIGVTPVDQTTIQPKQPTHRIISLAPNQPHYRILVVDDKWSNRQLLVQILSRVGFEVKEAANGQEAIEIWESFEPHLIWMDMRMPVMNGYEATQKIKASLKGQATAIIALTASVFEEKKATILSAGCDDIIYKPFDEAIIFEKIAEHLGVRYLYEENQDIKLNYPVKTLPNLSNLKKLPHSLIAQLEKSALALDEQELYNVLLQFPPQKAALAEALRIYVDNFEYYKILQAIDAIKTS